MPDLKSGTLHVCVSQADTPSGVTVLTKRTSSSRSQIARAEKRAREPEAWPIPVPSRAELTAAFAHGLALCDGEEVGHAARVCYVALLDCRPKPMGWRRDYAQPSWLDRWRLFRIWRLTRLR